VDLSKVVKPNPRVQALIPIEIHLEGG